MDTIEKELKAIEKSINDTSASNDEWNTNYFQIQKERYKDDFKYIKSLSHVKRVLELGAAPFHLSGLLKKMNFDLTLVDLNPNRFDEFIKANDLSVVQCNLETEEFPFEQEFFDLVLFCEVFEHLRINPVETLNKISKLIKPSGHLYLTTPNFYRYHNIMTFIKGQGIVNGFNEFNKLNTIGHMGHVKEYSKMEMIQFIKNAGLKVVDFSYRSSPLRPLWSIHGLSERIFHGSRSHMKFLCSKAK